MCLVRVGEWCASRVHKKEGEERFPNFLSFANLQEFCCGKMSEGIFDRRSVLWVHHSSSCHPVALEVGVFLLSVSRSLVITAQSGRGKSRTQEALTPRSLANEVTAKFAVFLSHRGKSSVEEVY